MQVPNKSPNSTRWCLSVVKQTHQILGSEALPYIWVSHNGPEEIHGRSSFQAWAQSLMIFLKACQIAFFKAIFSQNGIYMLFLCRQGHMDATLIKSYTYQLFQVTNPSILTFLLILRKPWRFYCCQASWSLISIVNRGCSSVTSDEWCTETWSRLTCSSTKTGWCWSNFDTLASPLHVVLDQKPLLTGDQDCWFWTRPRLWSSCQGLHSRGGHSVVQVTWIF